MEPTESTWEAVGARIRQLRKAKGWSGTDLGERVGVRPGEVSRVENGAPIKDDTLARYADALDVTPLFLRYGVTGTTQDTDRIRDDAYRQGRLDAVEQVRRSMDGILDQAKAPTPPVAAEPVELRQTIDRVGLLAATINNRVAQGADGRTIAPLSTELRQLVRTSLARSGASPELLDALTDAFIDVFTPRPPSAAVQNAEEEEDKRRKHH